MSWYSKGMELTPSEQKSLAKLKDRRFVQAESDTARTFGWAAVLGFIALGLAVLA